jgi:hypothetical protein
VLWRVCVCLQLWLSKQEVSVKQTDPVDILELLSQWSGYVHHQAMHWSHDRVKPLQAAVYLTQSHAKIHVRFVPS